MITSQCEMSNVKELKGLVTTARATQVAGSSRQGLYTFEVCNYHSGLQN